MDRFDKTQLRMLRPILEKALADALATHGIKPIVGNMRFDDFNCKVNLELKLSGSAEQEQAQSQREFDLYAPMFGLEKDDLGKTFTMRGTQYTITGISPNRPKFPIDGVRSDGKKFKFPEDSVKFAFGRIQRGAPFKSVQVIR